MDEHIKQTTKYETPGGYTYDSLEEAKYEMTLEVLDEKAETGSTAKAIRDAMHQGLYAEVLNTLEHYKAWFDSTRIG